MARGRQEAALRLVGFVRGGTRQEELGFRGFAVGHIANRSCNQQLLALPDGAQTDFDWKGSAVLALSEELEPETHQTRTQAVHVAVSMAEVTSAKPLGHQNLDRLTYYEIVGIAEQDRDLPICEADDSRRVDDEHRIRSRIERAPCKFG